MTSELLFIFAAVAGVVVYAAVMLSLTRGSRGNVEGNIPIFSINDFYSLKTLAEQHSKKIEALEEAVADIKAAISLKPEERRNT